MPSKQGRKMTKSGVGAGSAGKTGNAGNLNDGGIGSRDPAGSGKL